MKKIKLILLFSLIFITYIRVKNNIYTTHLEQNQTKIDGIIFDIKDYDNRKTYIVKGIEKVLVNCYECEYNLQIGDKVIIEGTLKLPRENSNFNLFNYRKYLMSKKIYWTMELNKIEVVGKSNNILYFLKNWVINRLGNNKYLNAFIIGNNIYIEEDIEESYQKNGITHLLALSGSQVTLLSSIIFLFIKGFIKNKILNTIIISVFLTIFMFITGFTPSVLRSVLIFIVYNLIKIDKIDALGLVCFSLLLYNPFYIYDNGFSFSFIISFYIILFSKKIKTKNYLINLLYISLIASLASVPILANSFFEINLTSFLINLFFVPLVSFVIFPLSLIVLIIPFLEPIFNFLVIFMENSSLLFNKLNYLMIMPKMHIILVIVYYLLLYLVFKKSHKHLLVMLIFIILCSNLHFYKIYPEITFINVEQGDSILISFKNKNILIDTGGNPMNDNVGKNILVPYLKSVGVKKIDYLILTHGDYDHAGGSERLINDYKISNIIFNSYENNELESKLIEISKLKKINTYFYSKNKLNIDDIVFNFLNKKNKNENKDSLIIYTALNKKNILLLADATKEEEKYILKEYNFENVDILKIGHHGSKTSTSDELLNLDIKNAVISVGKNNMFKHPSQEIVAKIENKNIPLYMTSINGTIKFILKDKLLLYTCR
ncbi:MAG: DNA internalization-related competence protein ComEC/Rec2 [Bacilli bacterium]|nr:DNA internalization-related competence protein ComEC/Rec2 [Bacilli bacterium]MDD4733707.1 DNA internalization-related competence protein ComEC/Rec2 [Bacilli bacterium]